MHAKLSLGGRRLRQDVDVAVRRENNAFLPTGFTLDLNFVMQGLGIDQHIAIDVSRNRFLMDTKDKNHPEERSGRSDQAVSDQVADEPQEPANHSD